MPTLPLEEARTLIDEVLAPWVKDLGLQLIAIDEGGADFRLPKNKALVHPGKVVCGQAIAAAADSAIVIALSAVNGRFRMCTTVDFTSHFIRPIPPGAVDMRVDVLSNGKRMAYSRVEFRAAGNEKLAATVISTFAYLED